MLATEQSQGDVRDIFSRTGLLARDGGTKEFACFFLE